jgi:hypothetical protein
MAQTRKRKKKVTDTRRYSKVTDHKLQGKKLIPPFRQLKNLKPTSWMDERLPEMLWCVLVRGALNQEDFVRLIREIARIFKGIPDENRKFDLTLTGLSSLPEEVWGSFSRRLAMDSRVVEALRPLMRFEALPGRGRWLEIIPEQPVQDDWAHLQKSVLLSTFHQSQEATDCRWARIVCMVLAGKLKFVGDEMGETLKGILGYPDYGDLRHVRPSIRALEGTFSGVDGGLSPAWCESFWIQCFEQTECGIGIPFETQGVPNEIPDLAHLREVSSRLAKHAEGKTTSSNVNPKQDAIFGFAGYALSVAREIFEGGNPSGILGRLGLRTILECLITLKYLTAVDSEELWLAYRSYGSGQVKLAFLKHLEADGDGASSLDPEILEQLANEDAWMEFVDINLADWEGKNLRQRAQDSNTKAEYDAYYPWNSGFSHGNWGAIRSTVMETCSNPLHRFHRVLRTDAVALPDVRHDVCVLVDNIFAVVESQYPGFDQRLLSRV